MGREIQSQAWAPACILPPVWFYRHTYTTPSSIICLMVLVAPWTEAGEISSSGCLLGLEGRLGSTQTALMELRLHHRLLWEQSHTRSACAQFTVRL